MRPSGTLWRDFRQGQASPKSGARRCRLVTVSPEEDRLFCVCTKELIRFYSSLHDVTKICFQSIQVFMHAHGYEKVFVYLYMYAHRYNQYLIHIYVHTYKYEQDIIHIYVYAHK